MLHTRSNFIKNSTALCYTLDVREFVIIKVKRRKPMQHVEIITSNSLKVSACYCNVLQDLPTLECKATKIIILEDVMISTTYQQIKTVNSKYNFLLKAKTDKKKKYLNFSYDATRFTILLSFQCYQHRLGFFIFFNPFFYEHLLNTVITYYGCSIHPQINIHCTMVVVGKTRFMSTCEFLWER